MNKLYRKSFLYIPVFIGVLVLASCSTAPLNNSPVSIVNAQVVDVVYETETGYVSTDEGDIRLPDKATEIDIADEEFISLIDSLKTVIGARALLHIRDGILVGFETENHDMAVLPSFKLRTKKVYSQPPDTITTTMLRWEMDTYRLSIFTSDGTYCIQDDYVVNDYYDNVRRKLEKYCKMQDKVRIRVTIKFHDGQSSYECAGEVEDIEM